MKLIFVGTGTMSSITRCNTSLLVDDILFDIGSGTVKQIERLKIYTKAVKYVVISHFHADHFLDIPNLLVGRKVRKEMDSTMIFIGPKGLKRKIRELMIFTHADGNPNKYDNMEEKYNLKFIELDNGEEYVTDKFKLTAFSLNHGTCIPVNGYVLEKEGKKVAYACDTTLCDNYYSMCKISDYMFSDVSKKGESSEIHIGLEDYKELYKKYPNCKFYAIHRGDYDISEISSVEFPNDGDILVIPNNRRM